MLVVIVSSGHVLDYLLCSLSPRSAVLLVEIAICFVLLLLAKEVVFLIGVKISKNISRMKKILFCSHSYNIVYCIASFIMFYSC